LVLHGDYPAERFEVLVGDHGSSDHTAQILGDWSRTTPRVRRIAVPFDGPNRAKVRNRLIEAAEGDLLIFLDHDVLASDGLISAHVEAHRRFPDALVAGTTYGKGPFRRELDHVLSSIDLGHVGTSEDFLRSRPELSDWRLAADLAFLGKEPADISSVLSPTRFLWTCNVSAERKSVVEYGRFDEGYMGWGLEDDDFAHLFYLRDRPLVFAPRAWAFHLPHPADLVSQQLSWRRNFDRLFTKFPSRELEYFYLLPSSVSGVAEQLERSIQMIHQLGADDVLETVAPVMSPAVGRRLGYFVVDERMAKRLALTDALCPALDVKARPRTVGDVRVWPILGTRTPFADVAMDETVLLADLLMLLDDFALSMVLDEACRISKRIVVGAGRRCREPGFEAAARGFFRRVGAIRGREVRLVGSGVTMAA
jgi:glycosyltransferase involved in cell wall biosynthesis